MEIDGIDRDTAKTKKLEIDLLNGNRVEWNPGLWVENGGLHRPGGVGRNPNTANTMTTAVELPL